uniref:Uncharacterized protein n=1 Tax=Cynoglossus semilaevis TaxID=244447 RepID=A0A3P8W1I4_CYNSE
VFFFFYGVLSGLQTPINHQSIINTMPRTVRLDPHWMLKRKISLIYFEDVVVGEALSVEEVPEELRAAEVQVCGKLDLVLGKSSIPTELLDSTCLCRGYRRLTHIVLLILLFFFLVQMELYVMW